MNTFKSTIILLGIILGFYGCGDNCIDCADAIDHMFEKIDQNGCSPDRMENAVNRIQQNCGGNELFYVYYMAETCCNGEKKSSYCNSRVEEQHYNAPFKITINGNSEGKLKYQLSSDLSAGTSNILEKQGSENLFLDVYHNALVTFSITDLEGNLVNFWEENFTFIRKENFCLTREIVVSESSGSTPQITVKYWN